MLFREAGIYGKFCAGLRPAFILRIAQVGRHRLNDAIDVLRPMDDDLQSAQGTDIHAAAAVKADKPVGAELGHHKADLVNMGIQQEKRPRAIDPSEDTAAGVAAHLITIRL